jgi:predicted nucleic-acid-binding Zn-ribbon protein
MLMRLDWGKAARYSHDGSGGCFEGRMVRVVGGSGGPSMDREQTIQTLRTWLEEQNASKCPLCREEAWEFDNLRRVFLISSGGGAEIGGESEDWVGAERQNVYPQLQYLRRQLRVVRNAAQLNRLLQLTCDRCGYVVLLNADKIFHETEEGPREPQGVPEDPDPQIR